MSIAARRVLIILAVVLLALPLLVIAGGILLLQSESTERWAEARIGDAIEREVEVEGIDFQFGWPPAINAPSSAATSRCASHRDRLNTFEMVARRGSTRPRRIDN